MFRKNYFSNKIMFISRKITSKINKFRLCLNFILCFEMFKFLNLTLSATDSVEVTYFSVQKKINLDDFVVRKHCII